MVPQTRVVHLLDSAHQNPADPAVKVAKMDVRLVAEMAYSVVDFPQHQVARTEVEETACLEVETAGFLEGEEGHRGHREVVALEEAFHVLLELEGLQNLADLVGRTEGREEVVRRPRRPA